MYNIHREAIELHAKVFNQHCKEIDAATQCLYEHGAPEHL